MAQDDPWAAPPGKTTTSSASAAPTEGRLQKIARWLQRTENSPVARTIRDVSLLPAEGINAALGAPQRINASRIANVANNPAGVAGAVFAPLSPALLLHPSVRKQVGNDIYAAFHPNDPNVETAAEHAAGVDRLMTTDPRFRGKLRNFLLRTGFETATDPFTLAGAGTAAAGERVLVGLGKAGTAALRSPSEGIRNTAATFLTNVAERQGGFTPKEIATVNSLRNKGITQARQARTTDEALLHANRATIHKGTIPPAIRQRLLREPYVYGTPEMRAQAVANGYIPTKAEQAKPPEALLNYNLRENYDPHTGMMATPDSINTLLVGEEQKLRTPTAGMEMQQSGEALPETLYDRVAKRLAQGRAVIRHRQTTQAMQEHLGVGPEMAHSLATETKVGGLAPLKAYSRAQVDALLSTGLPHMRNVGVAAYDAMGEPGVARGLQFFSTGVPKELTERLEESGGASHFGVRTPGKYSPARLLPQGFRKLTTGALDRFDQAMRAARLEQLDRTNPGLSEFEKMDRVNQDIGAYSQRPHYVNALSGIGANFPQWHNYIVPTMAARAVLRAPQRVERLARVEQNANDTFLPNEPYRYTLGGPNDEAASAAADPLRVATGQYPSYFGGPSSLGPGSYVLHPPPGGTGQNAKIKTLERLGELGANVIPFGGALLSAVANPFKSPLPVPGRIASEVTGIYTQKRTPSSKSRTAAQTTQPQAPTRGGADPWASPP